MLHSSFRRIALKELVPKLTSGRVNTGTKKHVWLMPHADPMLGKLIQHQYSSIWNAYMAVCNSLSLNARKNASRSFTPNRVLHGATNSVSYFQSTMPSLFYHLDPLIWMKKCWVMRLTQIALSRSSKLCSKFLCRRASSSTLACAILPLSVPILRPNHLFQVYQVLSPAVRGSEVNGASD